MKKFITAVSAVAAVALIVGAAPAPVIEGNESATGDYVRSNGSHMVINAIRHKNGTVTGTIWFQSAGGQIIIAAVDSLTVIGNSAYLHGIVTFDTFGNLVGRHSYHRVVDNGEGARSEPDRASSFANLSAPLADPISFLSNTSAILDGNIQVRDR